MKGKEYSTVSVSKIILHKIDKILDEGNTTYKTRSDFVKDALRMRLREVLKGEI